MTQGLFTSELGIRGDGSNGNPKATRTISLTDFHRRNIYGEYQRLPRPILPRRNAGIYLAPRAPDATVTASVVEVNLNDGTSISKLTEVPAATTGAVVSLSEVGSLTIPGAAAASSVLDSSSTDSSQETITTPPPTPSPSDSTVTTTPLSSTTSFLSSTSNNTTTFLDTATSQQNTVTVTATSTFEVSFINGTVIAVGSTSLLSAPETSTIQTTTSLSSSDSATFTFGQPVTTSSSSFGDSGTTANSAAGTSGSFTGVAGAGPAGSPTTSSGSAATSDSDAGSGSGGNSPGLTPTQQQVVGGVVGGVAGVAVILIILLVVLRWYRRRMKALGQLPEQRAARELTGDAGNSYPMSQSQRSSTVPLAAAVTNSLKRLRPHSNQTLATTATGATEPNVRDSERGFQRIAGRKIAPVLSSGGDPYGGNYGAFEKDAVAGPGDPLNNPERGLSGASFYRDSEGFYGGKGSHSPTFPPSPTTAATGGWNREGGMHGDDGLNTRDFADPRNMAVPNTSQISLATPSRPEGYAVMRPSPARTPVTLSPAASSIRLPIQQPPIMAEDVPPLPSGGLMPGSTHGDGVGRSLASLDGSRVSRSSGRSGGRFMENM
ncbi:hypothetical protein A1O3_02121 [Capronia epimyces CBS 606.96]|uniref:Uncharacterized protein n=1 Tax=Capronia epimyces CBS 606.96 TaxID=1182542 RepID=W9Y881_9EURO|nr:uncharacterized protein A1O3_02121 [Capronia epimyces CBS 606.96]EXJ89057.1 hypothetical protein A1O3_02121 [Capronia epimyces CBS 606.96]